MNASPPQLSKNPTVELEQLLSLQRSLDQQAEEVESRIRELREQIVQHAVARSSEQPAV